MFCGESVRLVTEDVRSEIRREIGENQGLGNTDKDQVLCSCDMYRSLSLQLAYKISSRRTTQQFSSSIRYPGIPTLNLAPTISIQSYYILTLFPLLDIVSLCYTLYPPVSFHNRKFMPFNPFTPFCPSPTPFGKHQIVLYV